MNRADELTGRSRSRAKSWGRYVMLLISLLPLVVLQSNPVVASTAYGDLNNFDVFNDTGQDCHGFEIELDGIRASDITYTYDWNHYGTPTITEDLADPANPKVFVRYAAHYNAATNSFSAFTSVPAAPPAPTQGHQCTNPSVNIGCEHFGVGHYGVPTIVKYNWLIDDPAVPGNLIHGPAVNVSTPNWTYYPPAQGQPAQVQAVILAPPPPPAPVYEFGDAVWAKAIVTTTHSNVPVPLQDLVSDDPADPNDRNWTNGEPAEVEVEWRIMQMEFSNPGAANNDLVGAMEGLPNGDEVITRRYEFYKYVGPFDTETNEALCTTYPAIADTADPLYKPECDPATVTILGDYIGAQMAEFDVDAALGMVDQLQDGDISQPYPARTLVVGGQTPYTTQVTQGALPSGLSIDSATGVLSGTPDTVGHYSFTITATDANNLQATKAYTLLVGPGSPGEVAGLVLKWNANGVDLDLAWDFSCGAHATDYAVAVGTIGSWYSHSITRCSTGGANVTTLTPLNGNQYYLVVPVSPTAEGSYGRSSGGAELPPAPNACLARQILDPCP